MAEKSKAKYFLCLDQGGHASRALVFDERGEICYQSFVAIETQSRENLCVEHDAQHLLDSVRQCIDDVLQQMGHNAHHIQSAGLATQRSSIVCWDKISHEILSPVISWQDRRAIEFVTNLEDHAADIYSRTGLVLNPHYGASKMHWALQHLPQVQTAYTNQSLVIAPLSSFLLFYLLQEHPLLVDPANGSRTQLINQQTGNWDDELLQLFQIPASVLPDISFNNHCFGHINKQGYNIPLNFCTGDQSAALFANSPLDQETIYINAGTGVFIQSLWPTQQATPQGLLRSTVLRTESQNLSVVEGTVNGGGRALQWFAQHFDFEESEIDQLIRASNNSLLFINSVGGLGAPYWQANLEPRFNQNSINLEDGLKAIVESIVFLIVKNIEAMSETHAKKQIFLSGGLANSHYFSQSLADLSQIPIHIQQQKEATAFGLLRLLVPQLNPQIAASKICFPEKNDVLSTAFSKWNQLINQAISHMP
ncbi:MAG: FGGY family carbohydrate kinase [Gammaproteobacteria bacterium]|nr:FGGY family carbohydrate kinase [Gammaproteobacteria bacterium]